MISLQADQLAIDRTLRRLQRQQEGMGLLEAVGFGLDLSACAVTANLIQHRPLVSSEPITPKFSKISPLAGAKRLFSSESLVNFIKGLFKISIVGTGVCMNATIPADHFVNSGTSATGTPSAIRANSTL